jgi:hypothetical protein
MKDEMGEPGGYSKTPPGTMSFFYFLNAFPEIHKGNHGPAFIG